MEPEAGMQTMVRNTGQCVLDSMSACLTQATARVDKESNEAAREERAQAVMLALSPVALLWVLLRLAIRELGTLR
jgi:hypothetical protein